SWAVDIDQATFPPSDDMRAVISITVTLNGTKMVYDHWEDGLEADSQNPIQGTTEVWGDGLASTGCPPTKNGAPLACTDANDGLNAGDVLALENYVIANPRNPAELRFDGGDLIASSDVIAVTRAGWPHWVGTPPCPSGSCFSGVVLAGAVEVYQASDWGVRYLSPVGEDISPTPCVNAPAANCMFEYTAFSIMAGADSTLVSVDVNGDGLIDQSATLDRGESLLAGNVLTGGEVLASKPVQVDLLTGDVDTTYEARWFALQPVERWSSVYYTPVGETDAAAPVTVFAYNPADLDIDVDYETLVPSGNFVVPAGGIYEFTMPANSGARFEGRLTAARDEFNMVAFSGSDGSLPWSVDWTEGGGELVGATVGDIRVDTSNKCHGGNCLEILAGVGIFIERGVDLTGAVGGTLTYDYEYDDKGGSVVLEASGNGVGWTPLHTYTFPAKVRGSESFDLTPYAASDTQIRFRVTSASGSRIWVDNLQIAAAGVAAAAGIPAPFYALSTIDFDSTTYDWGFSLIPEDYLATAAIAGWAPGSSDLTENGSPLWVTANADTLLYVDYDGDGTAETSTPLNRLQALRVRDPDNDQTGMRVWTEDGALIAAAWGQEPGVASAGSPSLDLGTVVLPFINPILVKEAELKIDRNGNGLVDPGDTLRYTLVVKNVSPAALIDPVVVDTPDDNVIYEPDTTDLDGVPIPDDSGPATPYPLDEGGYTLPTIQPGELVLFSYQMSIPDPLPAGVFSVQNSASVAAGDGSTAATTQRTVTVPGIRVTKVSDAGGPVFPGQTLTYTITVSNPSSLIAEGIYVQDVLPEGTVYVAESTVATGPGGVVKDNVPGGANPDLVDGSPSDLVLPTDGFDLDTLDVLTVTFDVQVVNALDPNSNRIVNSVEASSPGLGVVVSDQVIDPLIKGGRIGDTVWLDVDGDGFRDLGEPGLGNVRLELLHGSCSQGVDCRTTVTDLDGRYGFDRLAPGSYQVQLDTTTLPGA
ncbi:MAG: DUF11 domain-containing protein, partial [Acidimicrobiia bacterium]|nr:DUF11 domain-containing protein [Acidimicrobiia bacterium]